MTKSATIGCPMTLSYWYLLRVKLNLELIYDTANCIVNILFLSLYKKSCFV